MSLKSILSISIVAFKNFCIQIGNCDIFPANNIWNTPIDSLPVDSNSSNYINSIGADRTLKADFGSGLWEGSIIGIPFNVVNKSTTNLSFVSFDYADESDAGPYPIPANPAIEGGSDKHILIVETSECKLYELFAADNSSGKWTAGSGAIFDLKGNSLRTDGWTSADAAGLPILPGLVRYEEILSGEINHAIRFTAAKTRKAYVWPARHFASSQTDASVPPMGQRFRLKQSFDHSSFPKPVQIILIAMKKFGIILADNGSNWYFSGAPNENWDNDMLNTQFRKIKGSDFEAVDCSGLIVDKNSAEAKQNSAQTNQPSVPSNANAFSVLLVLSFLAVYK